MGLDDFTTFDDVRAALGVTHKEIGDEVLQLQLYEDNLKTEMDALGSTFIDDYEALLRATTTTSVQQKLLRAGRLFCTYVVANHLLSALPLFSPKEVSDGKASFSRYADSPYKATIEQVRARYTQYTTGVTDAYAAVNSVTTTRSAPVFMAIAGLAVNPITG